MAKLNVVIPAVEVNGQKYRKVYRKAQAGDIVRELTDGPDTTKGAFYEVVKRHVVGFYDDVDDFRTPTLSAPRFEVYEEATNPKPKFNVGDTVKLSVPEGKNAKFKWGRVKNGDIGKVVDVDSVRVKVDFPNQYYWSADPSELTLITAEEVKWAKIGRKVNEFKVGDIVQITANTNGSVNKVGSYGEVAEGLSMTGSYRVETGAGSVGNLTRPDDMRLIVPVEQRLDTKEAA